MPHSFSKDKFSSSFSIDVEIEQIVEPVGIISSEIFGSLKFSPVLQPTSIPSGEAAGSPIVVQTIKVIGISSAEVIGSPLVSHFIRVIQPQSTLSGEVIGNPRVYLVSYVTKVGAMTLPPSVTVRRVIWTPKKELIPILLSVWGGVSINRLFMFEILNRNYKDIDLIYYILEEKRKELASSVRIDDFTLVQDILNGDSVIEDKDSGLVLIHDK